MFGWLAAKRARWRGTASTEKFAPCAELTIKGNHLTGKGRITAVVTAMGCALGLTVVPLAAAYVVPTPAGAPGGRPTIPQGGSIASKSLTNVTGVSFAGYTGLKLALRTPFIKFKYPKAASTSCSAYVGSLKLGSGTSKKSSRGSKMYKFYFTNKGRSYLYDHNAQAISVTIKCTFTPTHGKKSTSNSKVVLAA